MSTKESEPVKLHLKVQTPTNGMVIVKCSLQARVEDVVERVMNSIGSEPDEHRLEVPLRTEDDREWHWYPVESKDRIIDAVRALNKAPRIRHEAEGSNYESEQESG